MLIKRDQLNQRNVQESRNALSKRREASRIIRPACLAEKPPIDLN